LHDSQVEIPLASMTAKRVTNFYDLMDSAYDAAEIRPHRQTLEHVPILDPNPRGKGAKQRGLSEGAKAGFAQIPHHMLDLITNCVISVQRSRGR